MTTAFASGSWLVRDGSQAAFVDRWSKFLASTTATVPGLHWAVLLADTQDSRHFVSVAEWDSAAQREAWRAQPHFPAQMGACRELCEEFRGADYSLAASVRPGEKNPAP